MCWTPARARALGQCVNMRRSNPSPSCLLADRCIVASGSPSAPRSGKERPNVNGHPEKSGSLRREPMHSPWPSATRSPEPSPCGYDISGLAAVFASLRRATRSETRARGGGESHPARRFMLLARSRPLQQHSGACRQFSKTTDEMASPPPLRTPGIRPWGGLDRVILRRQRSEPVRTMMLRELFSGFRREAELSRAGQRSQPPGKTRPWLPTVTMDP